MLLRGLLELVTYSYPVKMLRALSSNFHGSHQRIEILSPTTITAWSCGTKNSDSIIVAEDFEICIAAINVSCVL